jgi:hypothetical protein
LLLKVCSGDASTVAAKGACTNCIASLLGLSLLSLLIEQSLRLTDHGRHIRTHVLTDLEPGQLTRRNWARSGKTEFRCKLLIRLRTSLSGGNVLQSLLTQRTSGTKAAVILLKGGLVVWLSALISLTVNALSQLLQRLRGVSSASKIGKRFAGNRFAGQSGSTQRF